MGNFCCRERKHLTQLAAVGIAVAGRARQSHWPAAHGTCNEQQFKLDPMTLKWPLVDFCMKKKRFATLTKKNMFCQPFHLATKLLHMGPLGIHINDLLCKYNAAILPYRRYPARGKKIAIAKSYLCCVKVTS